MSSGASRFVFPPPGSEGSPLPKIGGLNLELMNSGKEAPVRYLIGFLASSDLSLDAPLIIDRAVADRCCSGNPIFPMGESALDRKRLVSNIQGDGKT
jgi:hypothetical protein